MAKKKSKKKAAKKGTRKQVGKLVDFDRLLDELNDAQKELNRIERQLLAIKPCRRARVFNP